MRRIFFLLIVMSIFNACKKLEIDESYIYKNPYEPKNLNKSIIYEQSNETGIIFNTILKDNYFYHIIYQNNNYFLECTDLNNNIIWKNKIDEGLTNLRISDNSSGLSKPYLIATTNIHEGDKVKQSKILIFDIDTGDIISEKALPLHGNDESNTIYKILVVEHEDIGAPISCDVNIIFIGERVEKVLLGDLSILEKLPIIGCFCLDKYGMIQDKYLLYSKSKDTTIEEVFENSFYYTDIVLGNNASKFITLNNHAALSFVTIPNTSEPLLENIIDYNYLNNYNSEKILDTQHVRYYKYKDKLCATYENGVCNKLFITMAETLNKPGPEGNSERTDWTNGLILGVDVDVENATISKVWENTYYFSNAADRFRKSFYYNNYLYTIGCVGGYSSVKSGKYFRYGLVCKIDPLTGDMIDSRAYGTSIYSSCFNDANIIDNNICLFGYTKSYQSFDNEEQYYWLSNHKLGNVNQYFIRTSVF